MTGSGTSTGFGTGGVDAGLLVVGRAILTNPDEPIYSWSGTSLEATFTGTSVEAMLDDNGNDFDVIIDGTVVRTFSTNGLASYPLASGLTDTTHELILYRLTEASLGDTRLVSLSFDSGRGLLVAPVPALRRLQLIGDSISCGYGNEGNGPNCSFSAGTENHYLSYGALTARALNADLITVAYSGRGMYRNDDNTTTGVLPDLWPLISPEGSQTWDFASSVPAAVVINLGTNDFAGGDPGTAFSAAYVAFVQQVRGEYPEAYIVCTVGPMLDGSDLSTCEDDIQNQVVGVFNQAGDDRVVYLEYPAQDGTLGYGCDYHPSLKEDQVMATELTTALQNLLGW